MTPAADPTFTDSAVAARFAAYPPQVKARMLQLRRLILATADATEGVGPLEETLKWGEPAYLTPHTKSGTTIRIDWKPRAPSEYVVYVNCQTDLIETFRLAFPTSFRFDGKRALVMRLDEELPSEALRACIEEALTYHARKRKRS